MNAQDAAEIQAAGGRVKRASWPDFLYLEPVDPIPAEDLSALDWIELTDQEYEQIMADAGQPKQTQVIQNPETFQAQPKPSNEQTGQKMTQIKVKSKRELKLAATYAGEPAEVVFIENADVSDSTSALILSGDKPSVLGIKENTGLNVKVKAVIKNKDGKAFEVEAISNMFDVIPEDIAMMPALDENGQPIMETNEDGTPKIDPATGSPVPKLVPAGALLTALVPEA